MTNDVLFATVLQICINYVECIDMAFKASTEDELNESIRHILDRNVNLVSQIGEGLQAKVVPLKE